jgi:hypothetical protein
MAGTSTDGAGISSGIGTGEAQVFPRFQDPYADERFKLGYAKKKEEEVNLKNAFGQIPSMKEIDIWEKHQPYFAQKRNELFDIVKQNAQALKKGDPEATIKFQQAYNDFLSDANLSKGIKQDVLKAATLQAANPDKYRQESHDYLENFTGLDDKGNFSPFDWSQIKENPNLNKYIKDYTEPEARELRRKTKGFYTNDQGQVVNTDREYFDEKMADAQAKTHWDADPNLRDDAAYEFSHLPGAQQQQYGDPYKYFQTLNRRNVFSEGGSSYAGQAGGGGYDKETLNNLLTTTKDFNVNTGETYGSKAGYTQTGTMVGYVPPTKPISAATVSSPDVWDMDKGEFLKSPGVQQVTLAGLASVPVLTEDGAKQTGSKVGSPATKEFLANLEKAGKNKADYIRYETKAHATYGSPVEIKEGVNKGQITTQDRNVLYPASSVANSFNAQDKGLYQAAEANTKRLNEELKKGTAGTSGTTNTATGITDVSSIFEKK